MGNLLMEKLEAEHGQPKRSGGRAFSSPLRIYVEEHYDEIRHAMEQGYTYKQLVKSISGIINKTVSIGNFTGVLSKEKKNRDKGYLITYRIGKNENTLWREFDSKRDIEKYVEDIAARKSAEGAYKVAGQVLSIKKMTRQEYERSIQRNNA